MKTIGIQIKSNEAIIVVLETNNAGIIVCYHNIKDEIILEKKGCNGWRKDNRHSGTLASALAMAAG